MRKYLVGMLATGLSLAAHGEATSQSHRATFDECLATQAKVVAQLNVAPSRIKPIVNTSVMTMTRICVDDGSVIISCSKPDEKMVITQSDKGC